MAKDPRQAYQLFMAAVAAETWGGARHHIGDMYYSGLVVEKDYAKAFEWYMNGAQQGYHGSRYLVGKMYELGQGIAKDMEQAIAWYRKAAADSEDTDAKAALGRLGVAIK